MAEKTKDKVYKLLLNNAGEFMSGQEIADSLYLTRASVWKAIKSLQAAGIEIDAVTNRGYRIRQIIDSIEKDDIDKGIQSGNIPFDIYVYDEVTSTNDLALDYIRKSNKGTVVISDSQTMGRGRKGRSFFSPKGTGVYLSVAFKPSKPISEMENITALAALALAKAIDKAVYDGSDVAKIKWVNDIFVEGKKVAGILTDAITSFDNPEDSYIVIGFGINVYKPVEGFPKDIEKTAGYLVKGDSKIKEKIRSSVIIETILGLIRYLENDSEVLEGYIEKSFLEGCYVKINSFDGNYKYACVTGINEKYHLMVKYDDGSAGELSSGEVSVVRY